MHGIVYAGAEREFRRVYGDLVVEAMGPCGQAYYQGVAVGQLRDPQGDLIGDVVIDVRIASALVACESQRGEGVGG